MDLCHVTWHTPRHVMRHVMRHAMRHVMFHVLIGHLSGEWGGRSINKGLHSNFYKASEWDTLPVHFLSAGKPERKRRVGLTEKKDK